MNLFILGVTGSIGIQTLDIVRKSSGKYNVISVSGNTNVEKMKDIIEEFKPLYVSMGKRESINELEKTYPNIE